MRMFVNQIVQLTGMFILRYSFVLLPLIFSACKKDNINQQLGIPFVNVDQYILLNSPSSQGLNSVGGWLYLNAGSRGIIVYHRAFEEYVAFDRHCTWQPQQTCGKVSPDSSVTVILKCACCTSGFSLIDGSVLYGPAINPLLQYSARLSDPFTLHVYN
jgi:nitrite reductase/ring-hydroxylating ferredoxin subunit